MTANNLVQNMDDFEDLQVTAVQNSAEFSRIGEFSIVSRRGSNGFHGRVTYDLANSYFNATPYFKYKETAVQRAPWNGKSEWSDHS